MGIPMPQFSGYSASGIVTHTVNGNMNKWLFFIQCLVGWSAEALVLDPSLYLAPSPPLIGTRYADQWNRKETRVERNVGNNKGSSTSAPEAMEAVETFWPMSRNYGLRGIHIPLTFSVSGTYGNYAHGSGLVGSSYASVTADDSDSSFGRNRFSSVANDAGNIFNAYGKMSLAGSSYGSYGSGYPGTRIYGGASGPSWSGWGNGKWGHYGKG